MPKSRGRRRRPNEASSCSQSGRELGHGGEKQPLFFRDVEALRRRSLRH